MTTNINKGQVSLCQGTRPVRGEERDFGYVRGEGGGFYFTWLDTLEATLASVDEDEVDGDGGLVEEQVVEFLREYLPTTKPGKRMWAGDEK